MMNTPSLPRATDKLKSYWTAAARKEGFATVQDAILTIYQETGSTAKTGDRLGFHRTTIARKLHYLHARVKSRGGDNNPYGRAGDPRKRQYQFAYVSDYHS